MTVDPTLVITFTVFQVHILSAQRIVYSCYWSYQQPPSILLSLYVDVSDSDSC